MELEGMFCLSCMMVIAKKAVPPWAPTAMCLMCSIVTCSTPFTSAASLQLDTEIAHRAVSQVTHVKSNVFPEYLKPYMHCTRLCLHA